jgi:hypothetical protein
MIYDVQRYQDFAPKMEKYGHLDPLLMPVAPETLPKAFDDYEFIHSVNVNIRVLSWAVRFF